MEAARAADHDENWTAAAQLYASYLKNMPTDTAAAKSYAFVLLQCLEQHPEPSPVDYYPQVVVVCDKLIAAGRVDFLYYRARAKVLRARVTHDEPHYQPLLTGAGYDLLAYEKQHGADLESQELRGMMSRMGWKPTK